MLHWIFCNKQLQQPTDVILSVLFRKSNTYNRSFFSGLLALHYSHNHVSRKLSKHKMKMAGILPRKISSFLIKEHLALTIQPNNHKE
jgi:hypothetical protein